MCIYNVDTNTGVIPLSIRSSDPRPVEKNWTPFIRHSTIHFIYSFVPLIILALPDIQTGECIVVYYERGISSKWYRGGTPALETSPNVFEGYLHTTCPLPATHQFSPDDLPLPARMTTTYYRTHRYTLDYSDTLPKLAIGPDIVLRQANRARLWLGRQESSYSKYQ